MEVFDSKTSPSFLSRSKKDAQRFHLTTQYVSATQLMERAKAPFHSIGELSMFTTYHQVIFVREATLSMDLGEEQIVRESG